MATPPPESDLDDEQNTDHAGWLHHCIYRREKQMLTDHEFITLEENTQCQVHLTFEKLRRNALRYFQTKWSWVKKHCPTEKIFPQNINSFLETTNLNSDYLTRKIWWNHFLKNIKIICSQRQNLKSESKKECRADFVDSSVRDLQRQLDSNRLEIYCTNQSYEESREEQARLHEEFAQRERVLRVTQIRSIHEVGELKKAQEMRTDEFSRHELRQSHATIQELTSHKYRSRRKRKTFLNDSGGFQDLESICSGKLSHVPSQPPVVPSPRAMSSRDQSLRPDTWHMSGTQGNVFWQSTCSNRFITDTLSRNSSLLESKCYRWEHRAKQHRKTCCEKWRTN